MNTMKNFAAQQLTKKQMNEVKGSMGIAECAGKEYNVEVIYRDVNNVERRVYGCGNSALEALVNASKEVRITTSDLEFNWY